LRQGVGHVPASAGAALLCLGDMPLVTAGLVNRLIAARAEAGGRYGFYAPFRDGRRGNPVLVERRFFAEINAVQGDEGARGLLKRHPDALCRVTVPDGDDGPFVDIDTPADFSAFC